ncbi:MAG: arginine--tRNA ligase [Legionellaceae bacterium]|nr:arginine--tRNA ligase [Legionellaceae bacterium]HCA89914.1 arginine--tRNA ligase [Legionellales bacterium]|tara:strand:- start:379 stop:2142 length:1764 start_codon:yes stop_codon:yes gene_type:complete
MKDILIKLLTNAISTLKDQHILPADIAIPPIKIDATKNQAHGDFSTNVALILAKPAKLASHGLAEHIIKALQTHDMLEKVEIAGPGFINFFMQKDVLNDVVATILREQDNYGFVPENPDNTVLIEFVSANPTGPLHVGHGRGAAFGSSLANVLKAAGFSVTTEYYVNDAGRQMDILAVSVWLRYLELNKEPVVLPANAYRGEYVQEISQRIVEQYSHQFVVAWAKVVHNLPKDAPEGGDKEQYIDAMIAKMRQLLGNDAFKLFHTHALTFVLNDIKADLQDFGTTFDNWLSEQSLMDKGFIEQGIAALKACGKTYVKEGALWFKATDFGDEKDRVLMRQNGQTTYFASDVAYHWHKCQRGFKRMIDIFGADHHGYVARLKAAMRALACDDNTLDVRLVQFAILYRDGQRVQMSTRSGSFVTLRELREEVGPDAARFFYTARKPEQHLDFDLDIAKKQSNDNPVYYVQYAHARIASVLRQLKARNLHWDEASGCAHIDKLDSPHERALLTLLQRFPDVITRAADACEPHQITYYLRELATALHSYYNAITLLCEDELLRSARLSLLKAVQQVLKNGLNLLGISAPWSM